MRSRLLDSFLEHADDDAIREARIVASALGPRTGQRVGILVSPGPAFIAALFGALLAGACVVVLSPLHPVPESEYFVRDSGLSVLLCGSDLESLAQSVGAPDVRVLPLSASGPLEVGVADTSPALMLYTSGTTGKPKGAILSHGNLATQQELLRDAWGWQKSDVLLHALPLHHMHGLCIALLSAMGVGARVILLPRFEASKVWDEMGNATVFMAVPTMYQKLFQTFDAADASTRARWQSNARKLRLATSGSAALPVSLAERWAALTGTIPLERFGMTEIGVGISNPLVGARKAGSVGKPLPTVETRIVDGELWIRGPSVFQGYHGKDPDDGFVIDEGRWFRTGDTVAVDDDGTFRILGRTSVDILKSGGYKLSAIEIEEALREHPLVVDCAVVGIPDEVWGDRVVACVIAREQVTEEALRAFAKEKLASYKVPKSFVLMDELPRNPMGKVQKPVLVALLREKA